MTTAILHALVHPHGAVQAAWRLAGSGGSSNPIQGWTPNFDGLGQAGTIIGNILKVVWAGAVLVTIGYVILGVVGIATHRSGGHPGEVRQATSSLKTAALALVIEAALVPVVGVLWALATSAN